jgi:hypothetical protein
MDLATNIRPMFQNMDFSGIKIDPEKVKLAMAASPEAQAAREEQKRMAIADVGANKYLDIGKETPEEAAFREQMKGKAEGKDLQADLYSQRMQDKAMKQQMAMAYARGGGHQAGAIRGAQMAGAEQGGEIAAQGMQMAIAEKQQSQQFYNQILQARQNAQMNAQAAHDAYLRGDAEMAQQLKIATMQNQTQLLGIQAQQGMAQLQAKNAQEAARKQVIGGLFGAGGAVIGGIVGAKYGGPSGAVAGAGVGQQGGQALGNAAASNMG